ncbi:type II secretion system F family protein [Ornithinimicrobium kibberense]|uniref:Type II secretion system F family protein n=1 Tax=Ornithinimicrobium kibberense TaxID=282060 RepID=A0ABV5V3A8_9MICO|nr:type II secretion system F family protein [Ornithinimicrobium kibberense]
MIGQGIVWAAATLVALALLVATWLVTVPSRTVPVSRRRWQAVEGQHTGWGASVVDWVDQKVGRNSVVRRWAYALDRAGIRLPIAEFVVLVTVLGLITFAVGFVLSGLFLGILLSFLGFVGLIAVIAVRSERRKTAFASLLDDIVQHLATNLRAGHSTVQALETVGHEIEEPARSELLRAVKQVRIGQDLGIALTETSERMDSDDFRWVAQAITIHRQVGGNLGEVLDSVSNTIRERQQVRKRVKALSAEGRISAWVLLVLPIFVGLMSAMINRDYASLLWTRPLGIAMLVYGAISMVVGALWMRKVVTVEF